MILWGECSRDRYTPWERFVALLEALAVAALALAAGGAWDQLVGRIL